MQKIKNIEFLRTFLIVTIVLFHMRVSLNRINCDIFHQIYNSFSWGRSGVEGFFIISGFFLVLTFKYKTTIWEFIKKKYIRLAPAAMFSIIVCGIASLFKIMKFKLIPNMVSGLLLCNFGKYWCMGANIVLWYSSALLFGLIVFFLILKYCKEKYHYPIIILLAGTSYLLLTIFHKGIYGGLSQSILNGYLSVATLRSFGGIGVGCIIAKLYQKYKYRIIDFVPNKWQFVLINLFEIASFVFIFWWSYFKHEKIDNICYVIAFCILFMCFISQKGYFSKITEKDIFPAIGKYSYSLFVIHLPILIISYKTILSHHKLFCIAHPFFIICFDLTLTIVAAIITYHLIEKPSYNYLSNKLLKNNIGK